MKQIPLTQGMFALVDDSDFEELSKFKWFAIKGKNAFYAVRQSSRLVGKRHIILMHRQIMSTPHGMDTDHRDHDGLNNRRSNLRICTHAQNHMNQRKTRGLSKYKGVYWHKINKKWLSHIKQNGKKINLGYFESEFDAANAYDMAAEKLFGEFAYTNFKTRGVLFD